MSLALFTYPGADIGRNERKFRWNNESLDTWGLVVKLNYRQIGVVRVQPGREKWHF